MGKRPEIKVREMGTSSSNPWKSLQPEGKGLATMAGSTAAVVGHLCVFISVIRSSSQSTDPQYGEGRFLFAHPGSHKLCASCGRDTCHMAGGGECIAATVLRAEIDPS